MEWLTNNWVWLALLVGFVALHFWGHRHQRGENLPLESDDTSESAPDTHHGCCGGGHNHARHPQPHQSHHQENHDCCKEEPSSSREHRHAGLAPSTESNGT